MNRLEEYNRKYKDYLIGKEGDYKCGRCKKVCVSTDEYINWKAMMTYYKCCGVCRLYLFNRAAEDRKKQNTSEIMRI